MPGKCIRRRRGQLYRALEYVSLQWRASALAEPLRIRHASEQYFTSAHTFSHFFRHVKGRPHTTQSLVGSSDFLRIFGMEGSLGTRVTGFLGLSEARSIQWLQSGPSIGVDLPPRIKFVNGIATFNGRERVGGGQGNHDLMKG